MQYCNADASVAGLQKATCMGMSSWQSLVSYSMNANLWKKEKGTAGSMQELQLQEHVDDVV